MHEGHCIRTWSRFVDCRMSSIGETDREDKSHARLSSLSLCCLHTCGLISI